MAIKKGLFASIFIITLIAACSDSPEPVKVTSVFEQAGTPVNIETTTESTDQPTSQPTLTPVIKIIDDHFEPTATPDPRTAFTGYLTDDIPTLDPQIAEDNVSFNYIENLFVQLTNYDPNTSEIVPEAAASWEISQDGRLYTFHLRTDIPWVYHNPVTEETTQEADKEGNPRFVTAQDFVYGIRRTCNPNVGNDYKQVIAPLIVGCEDPLNAEDPDSVSEDLIAAIGVEAIDEATLTIELNTSAGYFLSLTSASAFSAVPAWTIEEYGEDWIENGYIVTNGRYALDVWVHNVWVTLVRNPLMPLNMRGNGNIEKHETYVVPDNNTGYALWLNNEVDISTIPEDKIETHFSDFQNQAIENLDSPRFYITYRMTKLPFDNIHIRRAFSAAFDREKFINEQHHGHGLPMKHFSLPGIFGAPPINEIGIGFNPQIARAEMELAGYPNCEGFPPITLMTAHGPITQEWIEFAIAQWQTHLGCSADLFSFRRVASPVLQAAISAENDDTEAPHLWFASWQPDYADAFNGFYDRLSCNSIHNYGKRTCNETDDLILQAAQETDPTPRIQLYRQIEEAFFGPHGEHPIIPIFTPITYKAIQPWYDYTPIPFHGDQWYNDTIDMNAKQAAQD